jgi:exodeoxyribonuclease-3
MAKRGAICFDGLMRIMTWNINSVRLRLALLEDILRAHAPDIVCLQETKCPDESFPRAAIEAAGYAHIHIHGMKSYNGVAILSKNPFSMCEIHHRVGKQDCRHIAARFPEFELHNLYIPAGGDVPDPEANEKFAHKLAFVDEMTAWFSQNRRAEVPLVAVGDFNIAPLENDVWSHKQLLSVVSHTPVEVQKLGGMQASLDWVDAVRHFVPPEQKCYTWWSYRNHDWRASNRGRRLDHIWVTRPLETRLSDFRILDDVRDAPKASDHAPVFIDLKV